MNPTLSILWCQKNISLSETLVTSQCFYIRKACLTDKSCFTLLPKGDFLCVCVCVCFHPTGEFQQNDRGAGMREGRINQLDYRAMLEKEKKTYLSFTIFQRSNANLSLHHSKSKKYT
jgi:hypothetical protein